jgi:hypothetical protein
MLGDVTEGAAVDEFADCLLVNAQRTSDARYALATMPALARLAHLVWRQFGSAVAKLDGHVAEIVGMCANKQVSRIAARPVVAVVTNEHAGRDNAVRQLPRYAVRAELFAARLYRAVAGAAIAAKPRPTLVFPAHVNAIPEPRSHWYRLGCQGSILPCEAL